MGLAFGANCSVRRFPLLAVLAHTRHCASTILHSDLDFGLCLSVGCRDNTLSVRRTCLALTRFTLDLHLRHTRFASVALGKPVRIRANTS